MKRILIVFTVLAFSGILHARQPQRGYRGFLDWSSSYRTESFGYWMSDNNIRTYRDGTFYTGVSTSHGYQINPMFFVGAGFGMERCSKRDNWLVPLFAEGRVDLQLGRLTPFGDVRLGANLSEGGGIYFSPTIGYRFNWGRKVGVNLGLGLTLSGYTAEHYEGWFDSPDSYEIYYVGKRHHVRAYFTFRVGFDF